MSIPETRPGFVDATDAPGFFVLLNCLVPGDGVRWPTFGEAVDIMSFMDSLDLDLRQAVVAWSYRLEIQPPERRVIALKEIEHVDPSCFARLLSQTHRAYYTAPDVHEVVRVLADAGPREPSPLFDPGLVEKVLATNAGKRRL